MRNSSIKGSKSIAIAKLIDFFMVIGGFYILGNNILVIIRLDVVPYYNF